MNNPSSCATQIALMTPLMAPQLSRTFCCAPAEVAVAKKNDNEYAEASNSSMRKERATASRPYHREIIRTLELLNLETLERAGYAGATQAVSTDGVSFSTGSQESPRSRLA